MIEFRAVAVTKFGKKLFDNFCFTIESGQHWVIQGPNGSGKTLLLQMIAGALFHTEGEIRHSLLTATDWDHRYRERLEKIHFIPTEWLPAQLAGYQGLFYQQRYYSIDDSRLSTVRDLFGERTSELDRLTFSERFNILPLMELPVTRLSNGQLKKVIILRQLVKNVPRMLIMDYPFDGLDAESRQDLNAFIDDIVLHFGVQIVMTAHDKSLPRVINRRLYLNRFQIERLEDLSLEDEQWHPTPFSIDMRSTDEAVVEMQDLTIEYAGKKIISNLNWRINKGERWALTGKNGSGKTTLFSLIYADHPMAYSQKVFLFGKRRGSGESIWDIKKRINYFGPEQIHFLEPGLKRFSGREYIGMQSHENIGQLADLIAFFDVASYIDLPLFTLSSGQLQLVLLINMFLDQRELLLLDEPFQFLDPVNHTRVNQYLHQYLHNETTLVLITHDEDDVAQWTALRKRLP